MTEQLRFQQGFRNRAARDLHEWLVATIGTLVDGPRDQALARSRLARHQDRGPRLRHRIDEIEYPDHLVVLPQDVVERVSHGELLLQHPVFPQKRLLLEGPLHDKSNLVVDDRLGQIVVRPHLDRFDRGLDRAVARDDDRHDLREPVAYRAQKLEAIRLRHVHVADDEVERVPAELRDRLRHRINADYLVALQPQKLGKRIHDDPIVVHQQ